MKQKRNIKEAIAITSFFQLLLFTGVLVLLSSCSQNNNQNATAKKAQDSLSFPAITILSELADSNKPKEIVITNPPKPIAVIYSGKYNTSVSGSQIKPISQDAQGNGFFTKYTTDNGLALDQVYCSYKDKEGNIWFGTNGGGVSKYDGRNFTNYTTVQGLANNVVWSITEDKAGNIWFGTDGSGVQSSQARSDRLGDPADNRR